MLVLAVGGAEHAALGAGGRDADRCRRRRPGEPAVAPPLYVQPASDAIAELARRMATFSTDLAEALRGEWSREAADR